MNDTTVMWRERASVSKFVASVWSCSTFETTVRTVLADPCITIAFISGSGKTEVVLHGPRTKSLSELLALGYTCTAIRLQPGVVLRGFPAQRFINSSLALSTDESARFWFEGAHLQFPDFQHAEQLIEQLHDLGYLSYDGPIAPAASIMPPRSYYRLLKRTTGLSPYQLHQLERIHKALRLLKQGVPAVTVAAELDFTDQSHLAHASRHYLGHTPRKLLDLPQAP